MCSSSLELVIMHHYVMMTQGEVEGKLQTYLIMELDEVDWPALSSDSFNPNGKTLCSCWIGLQIWSGSYEKKYILPLPGTKPRYLGLLASGIFLYQLSCRSFLISTQFWNSSQHICTELARNL
jgi:hypothetical protein